jgi:queuine tRNA-ribosyltransferase
MTFKFEITHTDPHSKARLGLYTTPHGTIETPNFIFCGTKASIKGVSAQQMREAKSDIILANTYHLMLSPGADVIEKMGGLHKFMGWHGPMFTDSGGFQIFSLGHGAVNDEIKGRGHNRRSKSAVKMSEVGAEFRSHIDGRKFMLSPEESIQTQRKLGADLIVQMDECTPFHVDKDYTARSMEMSMRWGDRSIAEHARHDNGTQVMYGIVQGGVYPDLRRISAEYTKDRTFFATAIGGSLGAHKEQMYDVVAMSAEYIHPTRPVHLLGIGSFIDVFINVRQGIDTFDCVSPTRIARHGWALVKGAPKERMNIRNAQFITDQDPVDADCGCFTCLNHSRGYIHHLLRVGEMLGMQLLSIHNVYTMNRLMREVRAAIKSGTLDALQKEWVV